VAALLAPEGSSLLLEQPEWHLHPSVQTKLADFFLSLTMMGKQCIIETHSEHIVNRLQLRMVQLKATPFNPAQQICIHCARREKDESLFEEA
jgi:predicted ATPase